MTTARQTITVTEALESKRLFGPYFTGKSWNARWPAVLKAANAEPLTDVERVAFYEVAEREPPAQRVTTLVAAIGRGGGKNSATSALVSMIAMNFDPRSAKLRPGEVVYIICIANDKEQAALEYRMLSGYFETIPALRALVKGKIGSDSIELNNKVIIEVKTNSYRSVRGRGILACILDECAFYRSDERGYANPDVELVAAVGPGLARVPNSMLVLISSVYRRAGVLFDYWHDYYGKNDEDVLVVKGTTRQFNPSFGQVKIDKAIVKDAPRANAEYNSIWRDDLITFISRDLLEAAIESGISVRSPMEGITYFAACDSSSGKGDSFTMAIAHKEIHNGVKRIVIDYLFEKRAPFRPTAAMFEEIAGVLRQYRCTVIEGDNYAVGYVTEGLATARITYRVSKLTRSEAYMGMLPMLTSGTVALLDHDRAFAQFAALERRTLPTGREQIDHPQGGHDDCSNAIALAACMAAVEEEVIPIVSPIICYGSSTYDRWANRG
jgi:hypothetical protein